MLNTESQCYDKAFKTGEKITKDIYAVLGLSDATGSNVHQSVAINSLPWHRKELVEISDTEARVVCGNGPLLSVHPFKTSDKPAVSVKEVNPGVFVLQNDQITVKVDNGVITSLYDRKNEREIIEKGGKGNQFVVFDDKPLYWQAWDVEVYHLDTRKELSCGDTHISENKAHRVSVKTKIPISDKSYVLSSIALSAAVDGEQSFVECTADVEWHEDMQFLKVELPVDVRNTEASYETAFGIVKRPTHYNTRYVPLELHISRNYA